MAHKETPYKASQTVSCPTGDNPERSAENFARLMIDPSFHAARTLLVTESPRFAEELDVNALASVLRAKTKNVNSGDMKAAEGMLVAQAHALQTLFSRLTEQAMKQEYLVNMDSVLKLAFRAQNQCRMTLETLSAIKNPPVVYAKQANFAAGHQQVINGTRENEIPRNQLYTNDHGTTLDSSGAATAVGIDPAMEAVGTIDRTAHGGR